MGIPSLFTARSGIDIGIHLITGDGTPGGAGGRADAAVVGSIYLDQTNGHIYLKKLSGTGADKWVRGQNQDDLDAALLGLSWDEPALVLDDTVYTAKSVTADEWATATSYVLDEIVVPLASPNGHYYKCTTAGDSGGSEPTWPTDGGTVVDGTSEWTDQGLVAELVLNLSPFEIDGVTVVDGSRILFTNISGQEANVHVVSGTPGVDATLVATGNPLQKGNTIYIQDGTVAGRKYSYNGTTWVQVGAAERTEMAFMRAFTGKDGEGAVMPDYASTNVITDGDSLETAAGKLDAEVGGAVTSERHVSTSNTVNANISILDGVAGDAKTESKADGVSTTVTTIDSVKVDDVLGAEWLVHARSVATPTKMWSGKILAIHNGTSAGDADDVDYNTFAILKMGSAIASLDFEIDLDGIDSAQVMRLRASSNEAVNIRVSRSVLNEQV